MTLRIDTRELDEDRLRRVEDKIKVIVALRESMYVNKAYMATLRDGLKEELQLMGLIAQGDTLTSRELGVTVQMVDTTQGRINEETLLSLGVSQEIVDKARIKEHINPFVRISNLKPDPVSE